MNAESIIGSRQNELGGQESGGHESWYGWVMVVVAALAMVATLPGRTHGLGMITERLLADQQLGMTRIQYGNINLWATLIGASFCLGVGHAVDRFGVRPILAVVMLGLGLVVVAMSHAQAAWTLFAAILLTRGLGQSALSVISITIVGKWFDRNVSLPMSIYSILMAGGFIAAALAGRKYADLDWRIFWSSLGWIVVGLGVLLTILARDRETTGGSTQQTADSNGDMTHREALFTPMFWICAFGVSMYGMISAGISLFNESILVDHGFEKKAYYDSLALGTVVGVGVKFATGMIGLYVPVNRLLAIALMILAISLGWLTKTETLQDLVIYVFISAMAGGMLTVLFFSAWSQLYGRKHLGQIQGSAQMMTVVASAVGPLLFAYSKESFGSYTPVIWICAGVVALTSFIAWSTPLPRKPLSAGENHVVSNCQ